MVNIKLHCDAGDTVYYVDKTGIGSIICLTCSRISRYTDGDYYWFSEVVYKFEDEDFNNILFTDYDKAYDTLQDYRATAIIN